MAQFVGTWKAINSTRKNYDEFCSKSGLTQDLIDTYRDAVTIISLENKAGDEWIITYDTGLGPPMSYEFKLGQELVTTDSEGNGVKFTATIGADGVWTQSDKSSHELTGWIETITTKRIEGNKMIASTTLNGVTMTTELEKQ